MNALHPKPIQFSFEDVDRLIDSGFFDGRTDRVEFI